MIAKTGCALALGLLSGGAAYAAQTTDPPELEATVRQLRQAWEVQRDLAYLDQLGHRLAAERARTERWDAALGTAEARNRARLAALGARPDAGQQPVADRLQSLVESLSGIRYRLQAFSVRLDEKLALLPEWRTLVAANGVNQDLRSPLLDGGGLDVPDIRVLGRPHPDFLTDPGAPFQLALDAPVDEVIVSDLSEAELLKVESGRRIGIRFQRDVWVIWRRDPSLPVESGLLGGMGLRIQRLESPGCDLGVLKVGLWERDERHGDPSSEKWPVYLYSKEGPPWVRPLRIASGEYRLPTSSPEAREDTFLLESALEAGLLHLDDGGRLETAPPDLGRAKRSGPAARASGVDLSEWDALSWGTEKDEVLKDLYHTLPGGYLRRQIEQFNDERLVAAVRAKPGNQAMERLLGTAEPQWEAGGFADVGRLGLSHTMPLMAGRLFESYPVGWLPWQQLASWPAAMPAEARVSSRLRLPSKASGTETMVLRAVGEDPRVQGGKPGPGSPACLDVDCDPVPGRRFSVRLDRGASSLEVSDRPYRREVLSRLFRAELRHLTNQGGTLAWHPGKPDTPRDVPTPVRITDRAGSLLSAEDHSDKDLVQLGLAPLIGLDTRQANALTGILGRLSDSRQRTTKARLTLDLAMQGSAEAALEAGAGETSHRVAGRHGGKDRRRAVRRAALLVLDAASGEILAAATHTGIPQGAHWEDLAAYDLADERHSPLRLPDWQQDGTPIYAPGSTFKRLTALALEQVAAADPVTDRLLDGLSAHDLDRVGSQDGFAFRVDDPCYPAGSRRCPWTGRGSTRTRHGPVISNFGVPGKFVETPKAQMALYGDRVYGLEQAIRDSMNSWFAWSYDRVDATGLGRGDQAGVPHVKVLTEGALDQARPIEPALRRLGFGRAARLDAGLLPEGMTLRAYDVLRVTPSRIDPIEDRQGLRQMAIGLRMQVTPLQLARVSSAIATGKVVQPHLLLSLDGREARLPDPPALGIRTDRIRSGMKRVPVDGTAKTAFNLGLAKGASDADQKRARLLDTLRDHLYAKTGTAPYGSKGASLNTAWLTGWLSPGAIPGETRTLAFACMITHAFNTGGRECAPVVAEFLLTLAGAAEQPEE